MEHVADGGLVSGPEGGISDWNSGAELLVVCQRSIRNYRNGYGAQHPTRSDRQHAVLPEYSEGKMRSQFLPAE